MRIDFFPLPLIGLLAGLLVAAAPLCAQQPPDAFRWVDFHSDKEADTVAWVTRSLAGEKWTAIREIGVEYDAALVVTTLRATPQAPVSSDTFAAWSVSLTNHVITPILKGVNLRLLDWMLLAEGQPRELGALYDDCGACAAETFFTTFHFDLTQHQWAARWMRGGQGAPIWGTNALAGVTWSQVYAVMADPNGRELLSTWNHFDYGKLKPAEDYVYLYDMDPMSFLERMQLLSGKHADEMKQRLCRAQDAVPGLERGQDSPLCLQIVKPGAVRVPATSPPANNRGQSTPPGSRY